MSVEPIKILLVEDQPADVRLTEEVLKQGKVANEMFVAEDGEKAMQFLRQQGEFAEAPRPDLVILDLNLPRMDGKEVLQAIKSDPAFLKIPVLMLTTSAAERDILDAYAHHVNAYITKPIDLDEFVAVVSSIEQFWLSIVRLPDSIEDGEGARNDALGPVGPPRRGQPGGRPAPPGDGVGLGRSRSRPAPVPDARRGGEGLKGRRDRLRAPRPLASGRIRPRRDRPAEGAVPRPSDHHPHRPERRGGGAGGARGRRAGLSW